MLRYIKFLENQLQSTNNMKKQYLLEIQNIIEEEERKKKRLESEMEISPIDLKKRFSYNQLQQESTSIVFQNDDKLIQPKTIITETRDIDFNSTEKKHKMFNNPYYDSNVEIHEENINDEMGENNSRDVGEEMRIRATRGGSDARF